MFKLTFAAGLLSTSMALAQIPTLTVYAPDYFTSEWGPGPSIESKFEETCNCDLVFGPTPGRVSRLASSSFILVLVKINF